MADEPAPVRVPPALVDFGRAIGRDLPASLASVRKLAAQVKIAARTSPKK